MDTRVVAADVSVDIRYFDRESVPAGRRINGSLNDHGFSRFCGLRTGDYKICAACNIDPIPIAAGAEAENQKQNKEHNQALFHSYITSVFPGILRRI